MFGAVAAAGFGVLFNFGWRTLLWRAVAGAVALGAIGAGLAIPAYLLRSRQF